MEKILIRDIKWNDRMRKDYGDITALAESIRTKGIIHPIVLDKDNNLIAGGRRLTAIISLGLNTVVINRMGELSPTQLRELELEENLMRKDLTWQENACLIAEIHRLKQELQGEDWNKDTTAKMLDRNVTYIRRNINLAEGLKLYPELRDVKDISSADTQLRRKKDAERRAIAAKTAPSYDFLHNADALSILPLIRDNSVDLILLDPPYGLGMQDRTIRIGARTGSWSWGEDIYDDSPEYALDLLGNLLREAARVLKEGAHCYVFFGLKIEMDTKGEISRMIKEHLKMQSLPLFWVKTTQSNKSPYKRFGINYESIYFCWKGTEPRDLTSASFATLSFSINAATKLHPSEKPEELYRKLISLSTHEHEVVLDPTAGGGTSITAALSLGRRAIGIERDEQWFNILKERVQKQKGEDNA